MKVRSTLQTSEAETYRIASSASDLGTALGSGVAVTWAAGAAANAGCHIAALLRALARERDAFADETTSVADEAPAHRGGRGDDRVRCVRSYGW